MSQNSLSGQAVRRPADALRSRVLIVDDHDAVRQGLARYLEIQGFHVTQAPNGETALAKLANEAPYSFVLTDLRLPDLDGVEVAQKARETCANSWIGLITGWDVDASDSTFAAFDAVLLKPVDSALLVARLRATEAAGRSSRTGNVGGCGSAWIP